MLKINFIAKDNIPVIKLKGRLDGYGALIFEKHIKSKKFNLDEYCKLIADFSEVNYLSSAGIRILLKLEKILRKKSGFIVLNEMRQELKDVLDITGLLHKFPLSSSISEAIDLIAKTSKEQILESIKIKDHTYQVSSARVEKIFLYLWGKYNPDKIMTPLVEILETVNLKELGYAFGIGELGNANEESSKILGEFISNPNYVGIMQSDGTCSSDFLITEKPEKTHINVLQALSLKGKHSIYINYMDSNALTLYELIDNISRILEKKLSRACPIFGFNLIGNAVNLKGEFYKYKEDIRDDKISELKYNEDKYVFITGIACFKLQEEFSEDIYPLIKNYIRFRKNNILIHAHATILESLPPNWNDDNSFEKHSDYNLDKICQKIFKPDNLNTILHIDPVTYLKRTSIWIYFPLSIEYGKKQRASIEIEDKISLKSEWETIIRRIYSKSHKISLSQLHGGFTSKTFYVNSYDKENRHLLPTVLKLGTRKKTEEEVNAYHNYVETFILNNSTTIMGNTYEGEWGGLRYNFVGINGPESKITWLTNQYKKRQTEELIPLFDRIFTNILKAWYGQPKWEKVYLYKEHNPLVLFPNLLEAVQKEFLITPEQKTIKCDELKTELPNPYYFLKYEFPARVDIAKMWYRCITHGDLNMQNILLDERDNIYIIDFSETRPRNIVSDFARLEPILKMEMVNIESTKKLKEMLEFEVELIKSSKIPELPKLNYKGKDHLVIKAFKIICRLRTYANIVTLFEDDIVPYLLALLEWTYPIVCYRNVNKFQKRYALYSASVIVKKIMELSG